MAKPVHKRPSRGMGATFGLLTHPVVLFFFLAGGIMGGASWCWRELAVPISLSRQWQLTDRRIEINSPHPWYSEKRVRGVAAKLIDGGARLTDPQLLDRAIQLMRAEPYVASIESAKKTFRGITIVAKYRVPVAWIGDDATRKRYLDAHGTVVVPDPGPESREVLLRILMPDLWVTAGEDWLQWPDARVVEAASICQEVGAYCPTWGVNRLVTYWRFAHQSTPDTPWELWTPSGARVLYCDVSSHDAAGTVRRVQAINRWIERYGPLDSLPPGYVLDVRSGDATVIPQLREAHAGQSWR